MAKQRHLPFGYSIQNGIIAIHPDEAKTVKRIFTEYLDGASYSDIANMLIYANVHYHPDRTDWNKNVIHRILENTKYCGNERHPAIIEKTIFEAVTSLRASKRSTASIERKSETLPQFTPVQPITPPTPISIGRLEQQIMRALHGSIESYEDIEAMIYECAQEKFNACMAAYYPRNIDNQV